MREWNVQTTDEFDRWFECLSEIDSENVLASLLVLAKKGPLLGRPYADTVKGSAFSNMKELRVQSRGAPIRAFYAFDPQRSAIVLCGGHKDGSGDKWFYEKEIRKADQLYAQHLEQLANVGRPRASRD